MTSAARTQREEADAARREKDRLEDERRGLLTREDRLAAWKAEQERLRQEKLARIYDENGVAKPT